MKYGRWEDAMIKQTALLEWSESRRGLRFLAGMFEDANAKHTPDGRRDPRLLAAIQLQTLRLAEPVYVSEEVTEVIDEARKSWKPERLLPGDAFTPRGFLWFPRPVLLDDMPVTRTSPGRATAPPGSLNGFIPVRGIGWLPLHAEDLSIGTYWISFYVAAEDEYALADEMGIPSRFDLDGIPREEVLRAMPVSLVHQWQWSWGSDGDVAEDFDDASRYDVIPEDSVEDVIKRAKMQSALVQTTWRIAAQLVPAKHRPQRQWWRNANRNGIESKDVTVIQLRRTRSPQEGEAEEGGALTVRFVVRGHWRNQWYPSLGEHRQIWISPYVKGPDGAPLRRTERAWEFVR